jgi:hypothetical protein
MIISVVFFPAEKAQNAPSLYATLNGRYNRNLLVDHYISSKRFYINSSLTLEIH